MSNARQGDLPYSTTTTSDRPSCDIKSKATIAASQAPHGHPSPPITITSGTYPIVRPTTRHDSPTSVDPRRSSITTTLAPFRGAWRQVKFIFSRPCRETLKQLSISLRATFTLSQIVVVVVFLSLSRTIWSSTKDPGTSEWRACDRPFGPWSTFWGVRACFNLFMHAFEWRRYWDRRRARVRRDIESQGNSTPAQPHKRHLADMSDFRAQPNSNSGQKAHNTQTRSDQVFDRMDTILTILGIYTSVYSCRIVSPHVWWLAFGIVCLGYVIVAELLLIAFIVFVLGPFLLPVLKILILCLGRHVDTNGNPQIPAEIPKMDKRSLTLIPLKVYIPPPFDDETLDDMSPKPPPGEAESAHEARFESGPHPFIQLEKNGASCFICLGGFVPPKQRGAKAETQPSGHIGHTQQLDTESSEPGKGGTLKNWG
ncbi:hypothetical protein FRB99_007597 [Tulasnella sp. 403]|nr:hypothetical protein FRB99_007597 [Tulasnella sp. 403]